MKIKNAVLGGALSLFFGSAQAALYDRGGGMIYDDVLNITWLQDANYAKTSGYDADGGMTWNAAKAWAGSLVYGGYDDWRLPSSTPVGGASWNYSFSFDGSTDHAFNITSPHNELSYMYYVNLGLKSYYSPFGGYQADYGLFGDGTYGGQNDVQLFINLQSYVYWSGTEHGLSPADSAWVFGTYSGGQDGGLKINDFYAWAVRDGDVAAPVPEPETYAMMLAGLGLLGVMTRRRKQKLNA